MRAYALALLAFSSALPAATFRVAENRVQALAGGQVVLQSPAEGLWSVACEWRDKWPAGWRHASPDKQEQVGEWTILKGKLEACGGTWLLQDAYRARPDGLIEGIRRFEWAGGTPVSKATLSLRFGMAGVRHQILLPGVIYYGNPSGARSGRVPVYTVKPGEEALFEEHRFPMPFAMAEAGNWGAALHTVPSAVPYANLPDQWWSLGAVGQSDGVELTALSGPCASNGQRSVVKAMQRGFAPYDEAWISVPPKGVIEKRFFLEAFPVRAEGTGFQTPVHSSIRLWQPFGLEGMPEFADILRVKYRYAQTRWYETDTEAGFRKYATGRTQIVMGWTGQAEALGYALLVLDGVLNDPKAVDTARRTLDFLSTVPFYDGGFHNWYDYKLKTWHGRELLNQGQAMLAFARAVRVGRARHLETAKWEAFLAKAADIHAARILGESWRPPATSEAAFIEPLLECSELFKAARYREAAVKVARHYADRHLRMKEPYWGGTLDASCEDKEAAALALQGFLALYERTKDPQHLAWARHAGDVVLSYTFVWDMEMPPGRLRDHGFKTRGWTVVSPQNQHVDVWGTIVAPDIYRLGQIDRNEDLKRLAILMYRTCGQMIDPYGGQGEQMHNTTWGGFVGPDGKLAGRGGYHEAWTVFWITAHFFTGAARFAEMGVQF